MGKCIVELGPGTGSFTKEIIKRKKKKTPFILIEINEGFFKKLQKRYEDDASVVVIHGSAENIQKNVDYVLSGLSFTSLPEEASSYILSNVMESLNENGKFSTFQYSLVKKGFIESFFPKIELKKVWFNFPPAYVFSCKKAVRGAYA
ncbi:Phospholipid N-methyltransferase [Bacillus sp. 71mf]|nr:Phospholipid N-methyltransferase [Bacillus sp. 71mf]SFS90022.1 Phospholipid N-methyltransferase [Bacillus sp. 103mf]